MAVRKSIRDGSIFQNISQNIGLLFVFGVVLSQALLFGSRLVNWLPVWSLYADPGYPYLLNGAEIINGGTPGHTDHPGTSMQWIIGIIEQITFWVQGSQESIFADIVNNPEGYAQVVSWVLLLLYLIVLLALGYRMWRFFGTSAALLTQFLLIWSVTLTGSGVFKLVPETLVLLACIALLTLLIPNLRKPRVKVHVAVVVLIGIICAVGVTSKVIFVPVFLIPILIMRWRDVATASAAFAVALIPIMFPTFSRLDQMWNWYTLVLLNPGRHGGELESSTLENLGNALQGIVGIVRWWLPVYLLIICLTLLIYVVPYLRIRIGRESLAAVALVGTSALVVVMGYKQAEARDFLLLGPLIAVTAGILLSLYRRIMSGFLRLVVALVALLFGAFLAAHGMVGSIYFYQLAESRSLERVESAKLLTEIAQDRIVAQGYDSWTEASALAFAEGWTNGKFAQPLNELYPELYEYSIFYQQVYTWNSGDGKELVTCKQIREIISTRGLDIVVPGIGTVAANEDLTEINTPDGIIGIFPEGKVGPNSRFKATEMQCAE